MKRLCRIFGRPEVVFLLALLLLLLLLLLALLIPSLSAPLALLLALLALLGLLVLSLLLARLIAERCRKAAADPKGAGSVGHRGAPRIRIPSHTYRRPDPLIYSQDWLMARGLAVTWDNPDIELVLGESVVPSHALKTSTVYAIRARIWNGSTVAPAVNVPVRFYYRTFGIGAARIYIGETLVNLPVKGAPGLPAIATHAWTTPDAPGHYCIQAELVWPDDADPGNNLGQENVDVKALNSPTAAFEVAVRNDAHVTRELVLEADAYAIPPLQTCPPDALRDDRPFVSDDARMLGTMVPARDAGPTAVQREARARHQRGAFALPAGWAVELLPSERLRLGPREERTVTVRVVAPDGFSGRMPINVNAFDAGRLVGGVTLYVHG